MFEGKTLEDLREVEIPVLDKGWIRLIDWMGSDQAIERAARQSYNKDEIVRKTTETRGLLRYLMRQYHTTPTEMAEVVLQVKAPMHVWEQMLRHRAHLLSNGCFDEPSVNKYSHRYSNVIDEKLCYGPGEWRLQSKSNKQGSEGFLDKDAGEKLSKLQLVLHKTVQDVYQQLIDAGVAKEQARSDMLMSNYTVGHWKVDLKNLLDFLWLRSDEADNGKHAQWEVRQYANVMAEFVKIHFPLTWEAWVDYRAKACNLSQMEKFLVQHLLHKMVPSFEQDRTVLEEALAMGGMQEMTEREWREFYKKILINY